MIDEFAIDESPIDFSEVVGPDPNTGPIRPRGNPCWTRDADISDVGGLLDKRDSDTEGDTPYAAALLNDYRAQRGTAFSDQPGNLVHAENVALARFHAAVWFRTAEKFRANETPICADERLPYWARVLAVPFSPLERKARIRARCIAGYRAGSGPTIPNIRETLQALLGDAYVSAEFGAGSSLSSPPAETYWPGINDGPADQDLGNGTWSSSRAHLTVTVTRPSSITVAQFRNLVDVQTQRLLDDMLRATSTFEIVET